MYIVSDKRKGNTMTIPNEMFYAGWKAQGDGGFQLSLRKEIMGARVSIILEPVKALYHIKNDIGGEDIRIAKRILEESGYAHA